MLLYYVRKQKQGEIKNEQSIQRHRQHWTQDTEKNQTKTMIQTNNKISYTDTTKTRGVTLKCSQMISSSCFVWLFPFLIE